MCKITRDRYYVGKVDILRSYIIYKIVQEKILINFFGIILLFSTDF